GGCRAGESGLHGGCGLQRSSVDGGGVVSIAESGISDSGGRGDRCDGELRVAAWAGGNESRVRASAGGALDGGCVDQRIDTRVNVCDEWAAAVFLSGWNSYVRGVEVACGVWSG